MPIDDLTALGQIMRKTRKEKDLTQQELSDLSHVSVKQIANIEKGKMNPSYLILRALAKVLHISLYAARGTGAPALLLGTLAQFVSNFSDNSVSSFTVSWV